LSVNVPEIVFTRLDEQLKGETGFVDLSWNTAATYLLNNKIHLEAALNWADVAISTPYIGQENFNNLRLKAQILEALNRNQESEDLMARALEHPSADATGYYQYGRYLIGTDKNDKAMAIFEKLNKKWPDHWLAPHGIARGYSALGDFKNAVKFEKIAHNKAPEGSKGVIESYLQKLEAGEDFN